MPIRRPRSPKPVLRHVAFLETMASAPEQSPLHDGAYATLLTLRLFDHWMALGHEMADPSVTAHRMARESVASIEGDAEMHAALLSILNAIEALQEPDAQPVLPRVYALGGLIERRGFLANAGDIYDTVAKHVDSTVHLDLAFDAHMRRGFCLRNNGELDWADQAYSNAATLATRDKDRVRVIMAHLGRAKVEWSRGNLPAADEAMEKLAAEAEQLEATRVQAMILHDRAGVAHDRGDLPRAIRFVYDAFCRTSDEFERDRVLSDLASFLNVYGAIDSATDALRALEITARTQDLRWNSQINLLALASRSANEVMFEHYRRKLADAALPVRYRIEFLHDLGMGYVAFGNFAEARAAYSDGLRLAEEGGANQWVFRFEEGLNSLELAEREVGTARTNRPEPKTAPDDIAAALRDLLSSVSAAAA